MVRVQWRSSKYQCHCLLVTLDRDIVWPQKRYDLRYTTLYIYIMIQMNFLSSFKFTNISIDIYFAYTVLVNVYRILDTGYFKTIYFRKANIYTCKTNISTPKHILTWRRKTCITQNSCRCYQDLILNSNVVVSYSWFVIGQCCNFQGINSTVEISWYIFRIFSWLPLRSTCQ